MTTAPDGGVVVRPCLRDELPDVLALWRAARSAPGSTDDVASLGRLLDHDAGALLVAEVDGRLAGTLIATWDGWRGHLYRLAVLPAHRRRGIALRLVREAERRLARRGAVRVSALVLADDPQAVGFWQAAGYRYDVGVHRFHRATASQLAPQADPEASSRPDQAAPER